MGGADAKAFLEKCLDQDITLANVDQGSKEESAAGHVKKEDQGLWSKILGYLGNAINVVCTVKEKILDFFKGLISRYRRNLRRNRRLFLAGKKLRKMKSLKGFFQSLWDGVTGWVGGAVESIKSGVSAALAAGKSMVVAGIDWAAKTAEQIGEYIAEQIKAVVKPLGKAFEAVKTKIIGFLNSPYVQGAMGIIKCVIMMRGAIMKIIKTLKNFIYLMISLVSPTGWIKLIVKLICGWKELKKVIAEFGEAWNSQAPKNWNHYGKSLGYLINIMGS